MIDVRSSLALFLSDALDNTSWSPALFTFFSIIIFELSSENDELSAFPSSFYTSLVVIIIQLSLIHI